MKKFIKKLDNNYYVIQSDDKVFLIEKMYKTHMGFIAQDLLELFPENEYTVVFKNGEYYNVNLLQLIAPMVKAIQELSEKVDRLEKLNDK